MHAAQACSVSLNARVSWRGGREWPLSTHGRRGRRAPAQLTAGLGGQRDPGDRWPWKRWSRRRKCGVRWNRRRHGSWTCAIRGGTPARDRARALAPG